MGAKILARKNIFSLLKSKYKKALKFLTFQVRFYTFKYLPISTSKQMEENKNIPSSESANESNSQQQKTPENIPATGITTTQEKLRTSSGHVFSEEIIDKPKTDTMEMHKHPHHVTHKKKGENMF
jgi:hypothetical protein